ncbi:MAG: cytochrome b/b6 domain-containing protein [Granulosicoccaceae bacterium]|jgi:cytochrome b
MNNRTYVWDPVIRLFHWTLALAFVVAYATGEEESAIHTYAGYLILALIIIRIVWGFVGTRHARFSDFLYSPSEALGYISDLITNVKVKRYVGHNPAAAWMVFALLISLSMTVFSGLKLEAAEGRGLLAENTPVTMVSGDFLVSSAYADDDGHEHDGEGHDEEGDEFWEEIHEFFANFTLLLVFAHIGGVLLSSFRHKENLIRSMFTGYK